MKNEPQLRLEVITPGGVVFRDEVEYVEAPGVLGYFGVLPGHAPFLGQIRTGHLRYRKEAAEHFLAVNWGFLEVLDDEVIVLAETAERPEDIDLKRAAGSLRRARERLGEFGAAYDVERGQQAIARAEARIEAAAEDAKAGAEEEEAPHPTRRREDGDAGPEPPRE